MKRRDIVQRAGRNLRQAKGRTILTSLAIAVGSFALTASLAAGEGARQYADKIIKSNVDPQSLYVTKDKLREGRPAALKEYTENEVAYSGMTMKALTKSDIDTLKSLDGVEKVMPTYLISAQHITFEGVDKKYMTDVTTYDPTVLADLAAGDLPKLGVQLEANEAVIPQEFTDTIGKKAADFVGKTVTIRLVKTGAKPSDEDAKAAFMSGGAEAVQALYKPETRDVALKIRAVSAKSSTSFSATAALFISDKAAADMSSYLTAGTDQADKFISATVTAKESVEPEKVKEAIVAKGLHALTAQDLAGMIFTMVNILQGIVTGFGILVLLASVFGIINTQYISVLERTSQIGLMKALGMPKRSIAKLFRYEAAWLGFIGGALGALIAFGIGTAINPWITTTLTLGEDNYLLIFVWWQVALMILALVVIAIIAGWLPARKAARLDPIEALRTE